MRKGTPVRRVYVLLALMGVSAPTGVVALPQEDVPPLTEARAGALNELADSGGLKATGAFPFDYQYLAFYGGSRDLVAFWAAVLGGIIPVPVAVGISDEHRFKLFRILTQLHNATLFTEQGLLDRLVEFVTV